MPVSFACPLCRSELEVIGPDARRCPQDGTVFERLQGIWRFLPPARLAYFQDFIQDYQTIRSLENRGSQEAAYYQALPDRDLTAQMSADWKIRSASFSALIREVILPLEQQQPQAAVLDLGSGNGWLANRLALRGLQVTALDLLTNDFDGLGCFRFYQAHYTPVQAEFDHLPFVDGVNDLVIFNASFHYAVDYQLTLVEALRVLKPGGKLVILDTPVYRDGRSGQMMLQERTAKFVEQYGIASNHLPSQGFLTDDLLQTLMTRLGLAWRIVTPFYGLSWALKPLLARLRGSREPARFQLIIASRSGHAQ